MTNKLVAPLSTLRIIVVSISLAFTSTAVIADRYPSDNAYTTIVQEVYHEVSADTINLNFDSTIRNRGQLCDKLINQHNNGRPGDAPGTNATFIGETFSRDTCLNALWYSRGYSNSSDLDAWTGTLSGTWYDVSASFNDPATWSALRQVNANSASDTDAHGRRRVYDFRMYYLVVEAVMHVMAGTSHTAMLTISGLGPKR